MPDLRTLQSMKKKTLLIAGGSGFLGRAITSFFQQHGWNVEWLSRNAKQTPGLDVKIWHWNPAQLEMDPSALDAADAVLNLAGLSLADGSWSRARKLEFEESRLKAVKTLSKFCPENSDIHFISASATGYYGSFSEEVYTTELNEPGTDFLAQLCEKWEATARSSGFKRISIARIGVVLGRNEGAYPLMIKPVRWGLGAIPGSGNQGISWIHIDDVVRGFFWLLEQHLEGTFNFTAPLPVSMKYFMHEVGRHYKRPIWPIHIPDSLIAMAIGEKAVLACKGVYAEPKALIDSGFLFSKPSIESAISSLSSQ